MALLFQKWVSSLENVSVKICSIWCFYVIFTKKFPDFFFSIWTLQGAFRILQEEHWRGRRKCSLVLLFSSVTDQVSPSFNEVVGIMTSFSLNMSEVPFLVIIMSSQVRPWTTKRQELFPIILYARCLAHCLAPSSWWQAFFKVNN